MECVPNISEGRRSELVAELAAAVSATPGCCLLDVHSDADHNRSVLTFAGAPQAVKAAVLSLAAMAVERIDMRRHRGVHPRIGALDVVPFVPLQDTTMDACVELARETGAALAGALEVPVYLYGAAVPTSPPRTLAELRRGGFEGLATDGLRLKPDFGPPRVHRTAGAVVVGARPVLIAFNVLLDTADIAVARAVARATRESGGGLPAVQALGLYLPGRGAAQVSTNLLDYRRTSIGDVLARVAREAGARGARVSAVELVGLAPAEALEGLETGSPPGTPGSSRSIEARLAACAG